MYCYILYLFLSQEIDIQYNNLHQVPVYGIINHTFKCVNKCLDMELNDILFPLVKES